MRLWQLALALVTLVSAGTAPAAGGKTVDRMYVLDCGNIRLLDKGRYISPGENVGVEINLLNSCYLIRRGKDWVLWETGFSDATAGQPPSTGPIQGSLAVSLQSQLLKLGLKPGDLKYVMISHTHPDHSGNVDLFGSVPLLMQRTEYDFAFAPSKKPPFSPDRPVEKLEGDRDVFGDGSLVLVATPGHTPGHQSLLVHLKRTGYVLLESFWS